jgi:hypothetical protein
MIQSRTILPYTFTYLPFVYYANNLSICDDIYKFKNLIELNNLFYSIMESSIPEEKARQFIINLNELSTELSPDIIIKYTNLYNRLPDPIQRAGIESFRAGNAGNAGGGGAGGGTGSGFCSGSDQMALFAREDFDDTRPWASPDEAENIRQSLTPSLYNGLLNDLPRGPVKKLEKTIAQEASVEVQIVVDELLQVERELDEMPVIITWMHESTWKKLSLQSKRNNLTLAVEQQFIDEGIMTEEQIDAERKSEQETDETLAYDTHNAQGIEKSRRLAVATKRQKENIRKNALNKKGNICNDIDEFHFRFNPNSVAQRLLDNPVELLADGNPDTHEDGAKTIKSRSGKRIPVFPDKNHDKHYVETQTREQEEKFSEVERSSEGQYDGPVTGDVGTKTNKNTKPGVTDPETP